MIKEKHIIEYHAEDKLYFLHTVSKDDIRLIKRLQSVWGVYNVVAVDTYTIVYKIGKAFDNGAVGVAIDKLLTEYFKESPKEKLEQKNK